MKKILFILVFLLVVSVVLADDYTPTNRTDFNVWFDSEPYLGDKMYATVDMANYSSYPDEDFKCISLIFAFENSTYIHVQSNPLLASPSFLGNKGTANWLVISPEELGYFPMTNGLANVYFRQVDQVAGVQFLYVVKCNSNTTDRMWEGMTVPGYKEAGKTIPGRMTWVTSGSNAYWLGFLFLVVFGIVICVLVARRVGRR